MFNADFYPTPRDVIRKMLDPYSIGRWGYLPGAVFLDPSAGKGDILDYLADVKQCKPPLYAAEIDMELRFILTGKKYRIIGSDWLEVKPTIDPDFIIQNPPFSEAAHHVLHSWEVLKPGGHLVSIIPDTLLVADDQYSETVVELITRYGHNPADKTQSGTAAGLQRLGAAFRYAERPTTVEVSVIRLHKPQPVDQNIDFDGLHVEDQDTEFDPGVFVSDLPAARDTVAALVARYNAARRILEERARLAEEAKFYLKGISGTAHVESLARDETHYNSVPIMQSDSIPALTSAFWTYVFSKTNLAGKLSSKVANQFEQFRRDQRFMAFTERNIHQVFTYLLDNGGDMFQQVVNDVFRALTEYHPDNREVPKDARWKSNFGWKLGPRIILPNVVDPDWAGNGLRASYYHRDLLDDFDKACCLLINLPFDQCVTIIKAIDEKHPFSGQEFNSTFFTLRAYKKGTLHIRFRDEELRDKFNQVAAMGKPWIGARDQ